LVQLCASDVCRSEIVSRILDMYQVASEADLISSSETDLAVDNSSEMDREEGGEYGGEKGRGAVEYIPKPPYVAKKPYYSVAKGSPKNENKNIIYQPKAKHYHQHRVVELEYEDDFGKNLKKIIDSTLEEQTVVLKEHSDEMVLETVTSETEPEAAAEEEVAVEISSYPNELLEPTGIHEKVEETPKSHGSADCAMIPKQELDRGTGYFRFFSS